jgi:hypothetical protein
VIDALSNILSRARANLKREIKGERESKSKGNYEESKCKARARARSARETSSGTREVQPFGHAICRETKGSPLNYERSRRDVSGKSEKLTGRR